MNTYQTENFSRIGMITNASLIAALFVLNSTSISNVIILLLLSFNLYFNRHNLKRFITVKYLVCLALVISILVGGMFFQNSAEYSRILQLATLFLCFPLQFYSVKYMRYLLFIVVTYLFVIQLAPLLNLNFLTVFRDSYYPIEDNVWQYSDVTELSGLQDSRFGGIYYNPNIMGQSMVLLFVIVLRYISNLSLLGRLLWALPFIVSILLSGSRTAIVAFLIISFFHFKKYLNRRSITLIFVLVLFTLLFYFEDITNLFQNFRSFNLGNLYGEKLSSGSVKLEIFIEWLAEILNGSLENTLLFFFGSGVIVDQFDFDLGYILQMFGLLGLTSIFLFIISIFRKTPKQNRHIYFIFLISIGATLIINFRFSILTFIILSMYLQPQLKNGR